MSFLSEHGFARAANFCAWAAAIALELWDGLFSLTGDILAQGVPTGIVTAIPPSGVWRQVDLPEHPDLELPVHDQGLRNGS